MKEISYIEKRIGVEKTLLEGLSIKGGREDIIEIPASKAERLNLAGIYLVMEVYEKSMKAISFPDIILDRDNVEAIAFDGNLGFNLRLKFMDIIVVKDTEIATMIVPAKITNIQTNEMFTKAIKKLMGSFEVIDGITRRIN